MKKTISVLLCALMVFTLLSGCGGKANLAGEWTCVGDAPSDFPADMILNEDGSGSVESQLWAAWEVEGNTFKLQLGRGLVELEYTYKLSGNKLTLSAEGETAVYSKK